MLIRTAALVALTSLLLTAGAANAATLGSTPISHGSGFSSVACHIVNTGTKPVVVDYFFIKPIITTVSHGNDFVGCVGSPPYTVQPGQGCTRRMVNPAICNQPEACFCNAVIKGNAKTVRGTMIGTVTGSTATVTSELRAK